MGLFDPPTKNIAKRVPSEMQAALGLIQASAEHLIPDSLGGTIKPSLVAMVMATWVDSCARDGTLQLSAWNLASIHTTFKSCVRIVGPHAYIYDEVIGKLLAVDESD